LNASVESPQNAYGLWANLDSQRPGRLFDVVCFGGNKGSGSWKKGLCDVTKHKSPLVAEQEAFLIFLQLCTTGQSHDSVVMLYSTRDKR